jgi:DNA-binding NtrC family response regulator
VSQVTYPVTHAVAAPDLPSGVRFLTLKEVIDTHINQVLEHTGGKKTAAARILGINRRTLYRRNKTRKTEDF